jgi:hypothetical protein
VSGPMPTHFRWLWYLVGLAGMALAIVGLLAMIGSIVNDGLILPALGVVGVSLGYVLVRYRRRPRQDAAAGVAATPADGTSMEPPADPTAAPAALAHPATAAVKASRSDPGRTSRR